MRINPVNYNYRNQHQNFKGVRQDFLNKDAVAEVIGDKIDIYNKVSDEKGFDIWLFKKVKGGMAKINDGYLAILQDKEDGSTIKEFKCGAGEEALKNFKRRLEDSVAWAKATSNMFATMVLLQDNDTLNTNPKFAKRLLSKMKESGSQNQMTAWPSHLKEI
jgi:hypothetical protein